MQPHKFKKQPTRQLVQDIQPSENERVNNTMQTKRLMTAAAIKLTNSQQ